MKSQYQKVVNIILTDIQFHMCEPRKPLSPVRSMEKSLHNNKPGRWYSKNIPAPNKQDATLTLPILETSELGKFIAKLQAEGTKFRLFVPKRGLPVYAGKDTVEFIEARKKRALDRARR